MLLAQPSCPLSFAPIDATFAEIFMETAMSRPLTDNEEDQQFKYLKFKNAYDNINKLIADQAFIAAYVIAFSILEDRLVAMYVVKLRRDEKREMTKEDRNIGFVRIVNLLMKTRELDNNLGNSLIQIAHQRNSLFHATMWNLEEFTEDVVTNVISLINKLKRAREVQKKHCGNGFLLSSEVSAAT